MLKLNIMVKTCNGLSQYFVTLNGEIISRVYYTVKDAEACLNKKLGQLRGLAVDDRIVI